MARARWLLVLLVGGALAVVLTLLTRDPVPVETVHQTVQPDLGLVSFDPEAVTAIVIRHRDGSELQLWRRRDVAGHEAPAAEAVSRGHPTHAAGDPAGLTVPVPVIDEEPPMEWELAAPGTAAVDSALVTAAVVSLAELRAYRRVDVEGEPVDVADFGLDPPRAQLEIHLEPEAGAALVLWVGAPTPVMVGEHPTYYIQLPGQEDVFVAGGPGLALVDAAPEDLLPPTEPADDQAAADGSFHD